MAKKILLAGGALAASSCCPPRIGDFVMHAGGLVMADFTVPEPRR
jgi:hypothetical protein